MSRTTPRNRELPPGASLLPEPELRLADLEPPLDLAAALGGGGPYELEIGFGKGRFLLAEAAARPQTRFLGIEQALPYLRLVRHHALARGLGNLRLLRTDARDAARRLLPAAAFAAIYVLFPDPWPKRRHHRRRLIDAAFAGDLARLLAPGGELHVVTDHDDYAPVILAAVGAVEALARAERCRLDAIAGRTHYASKLSGRRDRFHAATWVRRPGPPPAR